MASHNMTKRKSVKDVSEGTPPAIICSYYFSFCETASEELVSYLRKQLEEQGLQCRVARQGNTRSAVVEADLKVLTKQVKKTPFKCTP